MCQIRTGRGCVRVEGLSEITLKGVEQKRGEGKQRFLKMGQAGSRGGCLKKRGLEPPYELWEYLPSFVCPA